MYLDYIILEKRLHQVAIIYYLIRYRSLLQRGEVIAPAKLKANSNTEYEADTQGLKKFITVSDRQEEGTVTLKIKEL